jgi:lysophospholipase L1-like esterase
MSLRRRLALSSAILVALLAGAEGLARVVVRAPGLHERHGEIVRVLGLPELNALLEPDPELFWRLVERAEGQRVRGEIDGAPIDFTVGVREHRRVVPTPRPRAGAPTRRVLLLGDSCTFGVGVDDGESMPAALAARLVERDLAPVVVNAGVPGYSAWQGLRWLETRGEELAPDAVVAIFGFNDVDSWGALSDLEQAERRAGRGAGALLRRSRLVQLLARFGPEPPPRPRLTAEEFAGALYGIARWCAARQVPLVLGIWPWREQVAAGVLDHHGYQGVVRQVAHDQEVAFVDLLPAFLAAPRPPFLDHVHADAEGCALAARALEEPVVRALERRP